MNPLLESYRDFFVAVEQIGGHRLTDEECCQLLAWLSIYGGGCEAAVTDVRLNTDIQCAQIRLNLFGGKIPNAELLPLLQKYIRECGRFEETQLFKPQWLEAIEKRYGFIT